MKGVGRDMRKERKAGKVEGDEKVLGLRIDGGL